MSDEIMHVHMYSLSNQPSLDYYFDTKDDYQGIFLYLKRQMRLRVGLSGLLVFKNVEMSDGAYILMDENIPRYMVMFNTVALVKL